MEHYQPSAAQDDRRDVRQREAPDTIRSLTPMAPDYIDCFTVTALGAAGHAPVQWARAGLEDAAGLGGQFVWRVLLGLRLESRPYNVAGWRIADRGDEWLRVEASSWCMTAHLIVHVGEGEGEGEGEVSVATCIRYDRPPAALIWPALSIGHRRTMPGLLRRAVRVMGRAS